MGPAELLLEATFTDMRNGGDGDLTQAYKFAKKVRRIRVHIDRSCEKIDFLTHRNLRYRTCLRMRRLNSHFPIVG